MNPIAFTSPLESLTDGVLVRLVDDRRPEALEVLYARYAPSLLALGKRILGNLPDAEEVLQEIFLYIWNHPRRYDSSRPCRVVDAVTFVAGVAVAT